VDVQKLGVPVDHHVPPLDLDDALGSGDVIGVRELARATGSPQLQVAGFDRVYAVGDIASLDANKAGVAARQAQVVATKIQAVRR
jgi:hypothetical protein